MKVLISRRKRVVQNREQCPSVGKSNSLGLLFKITGVVLEMDLGELKTCVDFGRGHTVI